MRRSRIIWTAAAQKELRAINRDIAMSILHCLDRHLATGQGDLKKLAPPYTGHRLRCGDYRLLLERIDVDTVQINRVSHRREAYR
jgi:mRNA-degrading endonuclease RelE of RelBE toxin-antitoxin system